MLGCRTRALMRQSLCDHGVLLRGRGDVTEHACVVVCVCVCVCLCEYVRVGAGGLR